MQGTALSSSDSVRLRLEDASPAEELRNGIVRIPFLGIRRHVCRRCPKGCRVDGCGNIFPGVCIGYHFVM